MHLRATTGLVTAAFLVAACTSGREDVPNSGSSPASASIGVGPGSGGAGGAGSGGDDGPASTASTTDAASTADATSSGTGGDGGAPGTGGEGGAPGTGGDGGAPGTGGEGGGGPCENLERDGDETDVDCGGPICDACVPGDTCLEGTDCDSVICDDFICAEPTCFDLVTNGGEGDVDCGGTCDLDCLVGQGCIVDDDCETGVCSDTLVCLEPSCSDDTENGDETDVDCGGSCPATCPDGAGCDFNDECDSGVCDVDSTCAAPTCSDAVRNGDESDIDCGGTECGNCGAGKLCGGAADCTSNICTTGTCRCPAGMTTVPIALGGSYCIDPTEATYDDYNGFFTANPQNTIPSCAFNVGGYTPSQLWPPSTVVTAPNYEKRPVRYVDWCDAAMFCAYQGKRLCGAMEGGPVAVADLDDTNVDQWFNACTGLGANDYPYGDTFNGLACTESVDTATDTPIAVRNASDQVVTSCEGGVSAVYQMSGNVAEWQDSCDGSAGATDNCVARGGSFESTVDTTLRCNAIESFTRNTTAADIGIRCCQ